MQFLKKADGGYVPGRIDGELTVNFPTLGNSLNGKLALITRKQPPRSTGWDRALLTPGLQMGVALALLVRLSIKNTEPVSSLLLILTRSNDLRTHGSGP